MRIAKRIIYYLCSLSCGFFRNMEDFVTWVDSSKIRQHVLNYNDEVCFFICFTHQSCDICCSANKDVIFFPVNLFRGMTLTLWNKNNRIG